ncbi:hypothetical protein EDB13_101596 [Vibrio crassostreae]|nr:hypothetical protein EDB13_101596 [Vibrio crassostreae]
MAFPEVIYIQIYSPFHIIIIRHLSETLFVSPILILMPSVMVHRHPTKDSQ